MKSINIPLFSLTVLTVAGLGCTKKVRTAPPATGSLDLPNFVSSDVFGLNPVTSASESRAFSGALVVWSPNISRDGLNSLLTTTKAYNQTIVELSKTVELGLKNQLVPLKEEITSIESKIQNLRSQTYEADKIIAGGWVMNQVKPLLANETTALLYEKFKGQYVRYCDAKLFNFVTSDLAVKGEFTKRPSPGMLCEEIYKEQGYFEYGSTEGLCQGNPKGQNYFECLWNAGVLKTDFAKRGWIFSQPSLELRTDADAQAVSNTSEMAQLATWGSEGRLRKFFAQDNESCSDTSLKQRFNWIQSAKKCETITGTNNCKASVCEDISEYQLRLTGLNRFKNSGTILNAFPSEYINAFEVVLSEGTWNPTPRSKSLLAMDGLDENSLLVYKTTIAPVLAQLKSFHGIELAENPNINTMGLNASNQYFSLAYLTQWREFSTKSISDQPGYVPGPAFTPNETDKWMEMSKGLSEKYQSTKQEYCDTDSAKSLISQGPVALKSKSLSEQKLQISRNPEVTISLIKEFSVEVQPEESHLRFRFLFGKETFAEACIQNLDQGNQLTCTDQSASQGVTLSFDPSKQKLRFQKQLSVKDSEFFNNGGEQPEVNPLITQQFPGKSLLIELYYNTLDSQIPFWHGPVKVLDGEKEIFRGQASYLLDVSKASLSQLCKPY
jgi:hypothetical protein